MYTIYHIEGVKIGCSKNPKARVKAQGYGAFQVLEVHEDIQIASKREIELQIEYGYKTDCISYIKTNNNSTFEGRSKAGKTSGPIQGKKNAESGHMSNLGKIHGKIYGKIHGKIYGSINGKISAAIERTCPWCFKTIKGPAYFTWHGDRCKMQW